MIQFQPSLVHYRPQELRRNRKVHFCVWIMLLSMFYCIRTKPSTAFAFTTISIRQPHHQHHNLWHCLCTRDFHSHGCKRSTSRNPITSGWKRSSLHGNHPNNNKNVSSFRKRKFSLQSIEWSPSISSIYNQLEQLHPETNKKKKNDQRYHFILPDLDHFTTFDKAQFYKTVSNKYQRIQTIAACQHTEESLIQYLSFHRPESEQLLEKKETWNRNSDNWGAVDKYLIVGGNHKNDGNNYNTNEKLSSVKAIEIAKEFLSSTTAAPVELWGVANPNNKHSIDGVIEKVEAGASGIITQPLLTEHAQDILMSYPRRRVKRSIVDKSLSLEKDHNSDGGVDIAYIAGLALPKSAKSLLFWLQLLDDDQSSSNTIIQEDPLFQHHLDWFERQPMGSSSSLVWAQNQVSMLEEVSQSSSSSTNNNNNNKARIMIDGIHYMPMKNTKDLISLLSGTNLSSTY